VNCYSCYFNPIFPGYIVIETARALEMALQNPVLADIIRKLYPQRIPPIIIDPNPPDPGPFKPIMINLRDTNQLGSRIADVFQKVKTAPPPSTKRKLAAAGVRKTQGTYTLKYLKTIKYPGVPNAKIYDVAAAARLGREVYHCFYGDLPNITLNFTDYDRTVSELNGDPYTGTGDRRPLGYTVTDMNGNYIFRFTQPDLEQGYDAELDIGNDPDDSESLAFRPDIIVTVPGSNPPSSVKYESPLHKNVPNLCHMNISMPCSAVTAPSFCFNGNLIGGLGDVEIGGDQNNSAGETATDLDRLGYGNHLHADGTISVGNPSNQANLHVNNACWFGIVDVKGCLYNVNRQPGDPVISYYTIRYKKPEGDWQWVSEQYLHPRFQFRNIPGYTGSLVGPIQMTLNVDYSVDNSPDPLSVPAYKNIQKETQVDGIDWEATDLDRYMQLHTSIYEAGTPGTVFFMVEGYDDQGNFVPNSRDMIALYIDNSFIKYSLDNVWFMPDNGNIIKAECNLYRMKDAYLDAPLHIKFKANDAMGFIDSYKLDFRKCGTIFDIAETYNGVTNTPPVISSGTNPTAGDVVEFVAYKGTAMLNRFGSPDADTIEYTPVIGSWLNPGESYTMLSVSLSAGKRQTNGKNWGKYWISGISALVAVERIP